MDIEKWKLETARDLTALGSLPILVLTAVRVATVQNYEQLFQIIAASLLLSFASFATKEFDQHMGRMAIVGIFATAFYKSYMFGAFAGIIVLASMYGSVKYLKRGGVYSGVIWGIVASIAAFILEIPTGLTNKE